MINDKRIGVALSGGGYRAAGFHIGTLKKLNELGVLTKVDVLSTISGGSITGAVFCLHHGDFKSFEEKMVTAITTKSMIRYVLTSWLFLRSAIPGSFLFFSSFALPFTPWSRYSILPLLILIFLIIRYQFKLLPLSRIIEKAYNNFFYHEAELSDLCDQPELAIGSTNLQTSRHFTFSKRKMEDSSYAYYKTPIYFNGSNFPVARSVMASSCVPFAFTPVSIDKIFFRDPTLATIVNPKLVDGGVYDNQGIHKITQDNSSYACDIVLVSDAGNHLPFEKSYNNTFTLLLRTVDTFMARIKNFQMMQNIYQVPNRREIAYHSLGWDLEKCLPGFYDNLKTGNIASSVLAAHQLPDEWIKNPTRYQDDLLQYMEQKCHINDILNTAISKSRLQKIRRIGTNLTRVKMDLVQDMILHAANLTELQLRLYCPTLFTIPDKAQ